MRLLTVIAYTLLALATAFVQSMALFALVQFLARLLITAELLLAAVVIAEEFPDSARGWAIGAFMALASSINLDDWRRGGGGLWQHPGGAAWRPF